MLFLSIFLLAGLLPLFFLIRLVRMARSFEKRAELLVPHWPLESGEEVEMTFHCNLKKALTVMSVDVTLECQRSTAAVRKPRQAYWTHARCQYGVLRNKTGRLAPNGK